MNNSNDFQGARHDALASDQIAREDVIRMAREAGINGVPAGPGDDGIDTWYGDQYLPNGALMKFAAIVAAGTPRCKKCGGIMRPGKAIENTLGGIPDMAVDAKPNKDFGVNATIDKKAEKEKNLKCAAALKSMPVAARR